MEKKFKRKAGIATKINALFLSILLPSLALFVYVMYHQIKNKVIDERKSLIKSQIIATYNYYQSLKKAFPDKEESEIRKILFVYTDNHSYSEHGYFYVYDMQGILLSHRYIRPIGKNLWNFKDLKGNFLIQGHVKLLTEKPDGDFIEFWFTKTKNDPREYPKLSYTKKMADDFFIGTGLYFDDIENEAMFVLFKTIIILLIASIVIVFVIAIVLRKLFKPMANVKNILTEIAKGDLTRVIEIKSYDEIGELSVSLNDFLEKIKGIISNITLSSNEVTNTTGVLTKTIASSTEKINGMVENVNKIHQYIESQNNAVNETTASVTELISAVNSISNNIENQAAAVDQSSASIEEMASSINAVTNTAKQADKIAVSLSKVAKEGGDAIQKSIDAIHEIEESSQQISEIVDLITGIAEQTNLLAMNAAIEAAHAGEYGKGFAVVADEIRKLAENSASSGKEITLLVNEIIDKITKTAELTTSAITGLNRILKDVDQTNKINAEISSAMTEQSLSVKEILRSMTSLVNITEEVRGAVREQKIGSNEISEVLVNLKDISGTILKVVDESFSSTTHILGAMSNIKNENDKNINVVTQLKELTTQFVVKDEIKGVDLKKV